MGGLEHERHNLACLTGITVSFVWEKDCEGWRGAEEKCDEAVAGAPARDSDDLLAVGVVTSGGILDVF